LPLICEGDVYRGHSSLSRRKFIQSSTATCAIASARVLRAVEPARFEPNWASLIESYRTPDWFRDAKLGLWAHWSAQCIPETGDWYARSMYIQGSREYQHHISNYGHPTEFGFMEIENLWKAQNWDPASLLDRYQKAGAKYFVALANHHDNFDTYDSKYHEWNAVRVGPRRDIIGTWERLARERGLRFGVSNHSAHSWHWYQVAYGYDPEGSRAGHRYDAFRLRKADGRGKWWEGLDPQALYTGPSMVMPDGITTIQTARDWHEQNDRIWDEKAPVNNPEFARRWSLRCRDLIDKYRPDLIYFDNFDLPLGQAGLDIAAHYYNSSMDWNDGKLEGVLNIKMVPQERRAAVVDDVERGFREGIQPLPWQTDTCIGDWHYSRSVFDNHRYKPAASVIHRLCDIVSKNGNLLLSIPLRGDGTIDSDEGKILADMQAWISINGEAIYGTRPWRTFGEGPTRISGGMFSENNNAAFTARDMRFTTKGGALYAIMMGWPEDGLVNIASLAEGSALAPGSVETVHLVATKEALSFVRSRKGLSVRVPEGLRGAFAITVKICGNGLV
jgi:alpha-L-fucosidase